MNKKTWANKHFSWQLILVIAAVCYFIDNIVITNRFVNPVAWSIYAVAGILAPITLIIGLIMLVKAIIKNIRTNRGNRK
jgi:hypothetical protein